MEEIKIPGGMRQNVREIREKEAEGKKLHFT
jgi:hypothetical protein